MLKGFRMDDTSPLSEAALDVLTSLAQGPLHGYAMIGAIRGFRGGRTMQPGLLYTTLAKLIDAGWVEEIEPPPSNKDPRRRFYQLAAAGRSALRAEGLRRVEQGQRVGQLLGAGT